MPKLVNVKLAFNLPGVGGIEGSWEPDEDEQRAAWELYIELVTRITVAELQPDEGLLRETLSSLHTLFETAREILKRYGPSIARPKGKDNMSLGYLIVAILNFALRPVLAEWHPLLLDYESSKESSVPPWEHERLWDKNQELRQALNDVRVILIEYTNVLAEIAEVPSLAPEAPND